MLYKKIKYHNLIIYYLKNLDDIKKCKIIEDDICVLLDGMKLKKGEKCVTNEGFLYKGIDNFGKCEYERYLYEYDVDYIGHLIRNQRDSTDSQNQLDSTDSTDSQNQLDSTDSTDSQNQLDSTDSTDSTDSQNQLDSTDSTDSQNQLDSTDSTDSTDSQNQLDSTDSTDSQNQLDSTDSTDSTDSQNQLDSTDSTDSQNQLDSTDSTDSLDYFEEDHKCIAKISKYCSKNTYYIFSDEDGTSLELENSSGYLYYCDNNEICTPIKEIGYYINDINSIYYCDNYNGICRKYNAKDECLISTIGELFYDKNDNSKISICLNRDNEKFYSVVLSNENSGNFIVDYKEENIYGLTNSKQFALVKINENSVILNKSCKF